MRSDATRKESASPEESALADFAALALGLSGASAVRLQTPLGTAWAGGRGQGDERDTSMGEAGTLSLFGGTEPVEPLLQRIASYVAERQASERREADAATTLANAERANDIAQSAARRFEALFEGLPIACYACDVEGNLMEWNAAAEAIWGPAMALGWRGETALAVDPERPEIERALLFRVLAGETVGNEERELRIDGEARWHLVSAFPLRDGGERIVGAIVARLDITRRRLAQRELAEREARFRTVLEALHEGTMVVDENGGVVLRNASADRILHLAASPIHLGAEFPLGAAIGADGRPVPAERWPLVVALRTGQPARDVLLGVSRPGLPNRIWIRVNAEPLWRTGDERPMGAVATFREVDPPSSLLGSA